MPLLLHIFAITLLATLAAEGAALPGATSEVAPSMGTCHRLLGFQGYGITGSSSPSKLRLHLKPM